jgi:aerobic carbon-monoxide dehydrogenase large subunit
MARKPLRSQLNQIRAWVRQGRTDAWIAHQLDVSASELREFRRRHELSAEDEDTGEVELRDYVAVDDCGPQVNPMIVEGQIHGGIVQGVAQALWEEALYDADGTLRNPSLIDYCVPSAAEVPSFRLDHTVTPSPTNVLGVKGIGEAGTIVSTPTVINAVVDALAPFGVTDMAMPAHPERVWSAIREAQA